MVRASALGLLLATSTSITNVLMDVARKKAVARNELIGTTFWMRFVTAVVFLFVFLLRLYLGGPVHIADSGPLFGIHALAFSPTVVYLVYVFIDTFMVALGLLFYFRALQISDLSLCVPFLAFTPVFILLTGYVLLHELPSTGRMLGVFLVVIGSLVMNLDALRDGLLGPIKAIYRNKGSRYMLYVALILSVTNPIDKKAVLMSDAATYAAVYGGMLLLFFYLLLAFKKTPITSALRPAPGFIVLAGLLDAATLLLQFTSHRYIDVVVTITLKRAGFLLTVLAGWLIFREKNIRDRLIACGVMLSGVILIYVPLPLRAEFGITFATLLLLALALKLRASAKLRSASANSTAADGVAEPADGAFSATSDLAAPQRPLRCAFVGCGEIADHYMELYRYLPGVEPAICIDLIVERAERAAAKAQADGPRARVSTRFEEALQDDIDLVLISTPNDLHREQAIAALSRGKHVFLQKPLAVSLADGLAIVEAAANSKGVAGMYMSYFDHPLVHDLRNMATAGWFGSITQMHARLMHPGGLEWSQQASRGAPSWRSSVEQTGGGAFIQLAVHYIRLFRWIAGDKVVRIHGMASNLQCPGLEGEDSAVALLQFASGALGTLNLSWCAKGEELTVSGTEGTFSYVNNDLVTMQSRHPFHGHTVQYTQPQPQTFSIRPPLYGDPLQPFNQHRMFLEAIREGKAPFVTFDDGLEDLAVVTAFYDSVRTGMTRDVVSVERALDREAITA